MAWFERCVASGSATVAMAAYALDTLRKRIASSAEPSIKCAMAESTAGSTVFSWLCCSGLKESLGRRRDGYFIVRLVPFLVAEMKHELLWDWLSNLRQQEHAITVGGSDGHLPGVMRPSERHDLAVLLLLHLVKAEVSVGKGLAGAVNHFFRIIESEDAIATREPTAQFKRGHARLTSLLLQPTVRYLALALIRRAVTEELDPSLFDRFIETTAVWSHESTYYQARLRIHHPEHPSAEMAVAYLQSLSAKVIQVLSPAKRRFTVQMSLEAARLLLQQARYAEAEWVMDLVRTNYAVELGLPDRPADGAAAAKGSWAVPATLDEISNMQLLSGLDSY